MEIRKTLILLPALALLAGCGETPTPEPENVLVSIEVNAAGAKTTYTEGEKLVPDGLVIKCIGTLKTEDLKYETCPNEFTFSPSLDTPLGVEDKSVTVTYKQKFASYSITVEAETTSFTAGFDEKREQVGDVKTTGNTDNIEKFRTTLNTYYFDKEEVNISTMEGEYAQITGDAKGFQVTETRNVEQVLLFGGRKQECNLTITFVSKIKYITFICEPYCKYDTYNKAYTVDYAGSLTVNGEKKDLGIHQAADVEEIKSLKYEVNSKTITIKTPNDNTGDSDDKKGNRILVYGINLEY